MEGEWCVPHQDNRCLDAALDACRGSDGLFDIMSRIRAKLKGKSCSRIRLLSELVQEVVDHVGVHEKKVCIHT